MSKKTETSFTPRIEWKDAERRLYIMEEAARRALRNGSAMARIVVPVEEPHVPVLLPARMSGVLYGPDGRPMKE